VFPTLGPPLALLLAFHFRRWRALKFLLRARRSFPQGFTVMQLIPVIENRHKF
jgi:hypothetical protein